MQSPIQARKSLYVRWHNVGSHLLRGRAHLENGVISENDAESEPARPLHASGGLLFEKTRLTITTNHPEGEDSWAQAK